MRGRLPLPALRMPDRHQVHFFRQMEMLLTSGVLIVDALAELRDRYPHRGTRRLLQAVHADIAASRLGLSRALARYPRSFPPSVIAILEAAEESGTARLAERCGDLADGIAYARASREQVRRACGYPAFAAALAAALGAFILAVVFPRLEGLLNSLGGTLPPLAAHAAAASRIVRAHAAAEAGAIAALVLAGAAVWRLPAVTEGVDRALLRAPVLGTIHRQLAVALVCRIYRSLYEAGKSAPECLELCAQALDNRWFRRRMRRAAAWVASGGVTLAVAVQDTGLFPPLACLAIEVGERSGRLARALDRVAQFHGERARDEIELAIGLINPLLTVATVAGVGLLLLTFFQAVYQIVSFVP